MFNKKTFLVLMATTFILTACNKSDNTQVVNSQTNSSQQTVETESTKVKAKSVEQITPTTKTQEDSNQDDKDKAKTLGEVYNNQKLGFSFIMPPDWKGRYSIKEKEDGIYMYFKPVRPVSEDYSGLLFSITKRTSSDDEDHLDTVGEPRIFEAKGVTYITGGPTDVTFPTNHEEFRNFTKMQKEIREILKTIKASNSKG